MDYMKMHCPNCPNHCAYPGCCPLGMSFFDRMRAAAQSEDKDGAKKTDKNGSGEKERI